MSIPGKPDGNSGKPLFGLRQEQVPSTQDHVALAIKPDRAIPVILYERFVVAAAATGARCDREPVPSKESKRGR